MGVNSIRFEGLVDLAEKASLLDDEKMRSVFEQRRTAQAVAIFLAARKTREATCAFLSALKLDDLKHAQVLYQDDPTTISVFWYYLNPVYEHTEGFRWWNRCLNLVIEPMGIDRHVFSSNFFSVEIYGYHTKEKWVTEYRAFHNTNYVG